MSDQPSTDRLKGVAKDCVHCGFCLPACPTYQLWGEEMDSPRGRIHLISQILDGAPLTPAAATHFDRCLGCMACMTACPSGVQYDQLIEAARGWTEHPEQAPAEASVRPADAPTGVSTDVSAGSAAPIPLARRPLRDRATRAAIFAVFPYPARLRVLTAPLRVAQRTGLDKWLAGSGLPAKLSPAAEAALRLAPPSAGRPAASDPRSARGPAAAGARWAWERARKGAAGRPAAQRLPERVAARGQRRAVVGMLTGCVQSVFFPRVNAATARVLAAEGCDVIIPRGQGCCGALSGHSGRHDEAMRFARATIETFERAGVDAIVVNSAGCGSAMKDYGRLLADDLSREHGGSSPRETAAWAARASALSGRVRDLAEFLAELGPVAPRHPVPVTAAYHDACHLGHAQRITRQPRELLAAIPELRLVELPDAGTCCGSAGVYNLLQPQAARELAARKADSVLASGADLVISANPGCTLQISAELSQRGKTIATAHTAEILDMSINRRS